MKTDTYLDDIHYRLVNGDGRSVQDKAEELGLIELRPIKPEDSIDGETEHYFCVWKPKED